MRRELLDYHLPPELIASRPAERREAAKLLVVDAKGRGLEHAHIDDLPDLLPSQSLLVVNDTRVVPARLLGHKAASGGKVEIFVTRRCSFTEIEHEGKRLPAERWKALGRSSKPLREGSLIHFDTSSRLVARIEGREPDGLLDVLLFSPAGYAISEAIESVGHVPLPPYIHRGDEQVDRERYQTVFAREPGAIAAPTAGLHLTEALLSRMKARSIEIAAVTLHVGLGTFQPVVAYDLDDHPMHAEVFRVSPEVVSAVDRARERGAEVIAIGTTSVRALESAADPERMGRVVAKEGETRLLTQPGVAFRVVDRLLTNFHLPQSTLLALVGAFIGVDRMFEAYRAAIEQRYRFYSYGDAMLLRRAG
jgi:S-adenosylmethionine:tRNA ribosyltransferase-isomerase